MSEEIRLHNTPLTVNALTLGQLATTIDHFAAAHAWARLAILTPAQGGDAAEFLRQAGERLPSAIAVIAAATGMAASEIEGMAGTLLDAAIAVIKIGMVSGLLVAKDPTLGEQPGGQAGDQISP